MLVTFDSDAGGFTMFGDIAVKLLKMMGHSGTVPSAILAEDIPAAVARLQAALDADPASSAAPEPDDEQDKREPPVSLRQRAYPLIDLLTRAQKRGCPVVWK
jgi:Domain of unknown function (DUF1840)